jgi:hypothetical protein
MASISRKQLNLGEALYSAFPVDPVPMPELTPDSSFVWTVKERLWGRKWPYVIGQRLIYGELDPALSIWLQALPPAMADYYLPSHLMLASLLLPSYAEPSYIGWVVQALILPPSSDINELEEIDNDLYLSTMLVDYGGVSRALYERMTPEQRNCIALFLDLYLACRSADFTPKGLNYFERNTEFWRTSSLPQ